MAFDPSYFLDWITGVSPEEAAKKRAQGAPAGLGGGLAGEAQKAVGGRKQKIDEAEERAVQGNEQKKPSYKDGGYTGNTPPSEPAGTVHGQEYVIPADVVAFLGTRFLDKLVQDAQAQMGQEQNPISQFDATLDEGM